jgi:hypothetical protein
VFPPWAGFAINPETASRAPGINARKSAAHTSRIGTLYHGDNVDILQRHLGIISGIISVDI